MGKMLGVDLEPLQAHVYMYICIYTSYTYTMNRYNIHTTQNKNNQNVACCNLCKSEGRENMPVASLLGRQK